MKNMRIMRIHEAVWAYGRIHLFCRAWAFTKQISRGAFCQKILMLPHNPHDLRIGKTGGHENMRIMRIHEAGVFKGIDLPCIEMRMGSRPKHEADMRIHEADPHVFRLPACGGAQ